MSSTTASAPDDSNSSHLSRSILEAAVVLSLGSALAFLAIFGLRIGSGDSVAAVCILFALSVSPILITAAFASRSLLFPLPRYQAAAALAIAVLFAPCIAVYSIALAALLHVAMLLWLIVALLRSRQTLRSIHPAALAGKVCIIAAMLIVACNPLRFFIPEQMALGITSSDNLFQIAIAQMIAHYGQPVMGADGLAYRQYYFISHAVAAGLSKLAGTTVPLVYVYWAAISLKVQLLWAFFLAAIALDDNHAGARYSAMPMMAFAWLAAVLTHALESESFVMAMSFFLLLLPILCTLANQSALAPSRAALAVAIAGAFLCAATKASVGFFVAVALLGIVWRHKHSPKIAVVVVTALCLLAFSTVRYFSPGDTLLIQAGWEIMKASYRQYNNEIAYLSFGAPLLLLAVSAYQMTFSGTRSTAGIELRLDIEAKPCRGSILKSAAEWLLTRTTGAMLILGLSWLACAAVLFTIPIGSNIAYFSLVLLLMAAVMAPSTLRTAFRWDFETRNLRRAALGLALAVLSIQFFPNTKNALTALYRTTFDIPANRSASKLMIASLRDDRSLLRPVVEHSRTTPWARLMQDIREKSASAPSLAVHTPPDNNKYWTRLSSGTPWWCIAPHLMIPAELGIAQIRNVAPATIETQCVPPGIAFYGFGEEQDAHRTATFSDAELCAMTRNAGFGRLYVIHSIKDTSLNTVLDCSSQSSALKPHRTPS